MPINFIYTEKEETDNVEKMKHYFQEERIDNSFIQVNAKDMTLINNYVIKAYGKEELIKTTLTKCTKALGSNMLKITIYLISENIKKI